MPEATVSREAAAAVQQNGTPTEKSAAAPMPDKTIPGRRDGDRNFNAVTVPRGEMVGGTATGDKVEHNTGVDNRLQHGGEIDVTVKSETVEKDFTFLSTYVSTMARDPNLTEILQDSRMEQDRLIMEKCADVIRDDQGRPIKWEVNNDKVQEFLQSSNGIATVCMLAEDESFMLKWGMGMDAAIRDQFSRGQKNHTREGKTTRDSTRTIPGLSKTAIKDAVLGLSAAGYFVGGTGRTKLEFSSDDELLYEVISQNKGDKVMVDYLKARTGGIIDLTAIQATKNVDGTYTFDYDPSYNPDIDALKTRITNADKLRRENLKQLGFDKPDRMGFVSRDRQIRFLEEFILDEDGGRTWYGQKREGAKAEDLPVTYVNQILGRYRELVAGAGANPSRYERLNLINQARREIMVSYLDEDIKLEKAGHAEARKGKDIAAIKEKGRRMRENADEYRAEQRTKLTEEITEIAGKRDAAVRSGTELVGGPEGVIARSKAVQEIIDELETDQYGGVEVSIDMEGAIKARKTELEGFIAAEASKADYTRLLGEMKRDMAEAEKDARDSYNATVAAARGKGITIQGTMHEAVAEARVKVEAQYNPQLDPYQSKIAKWKRQLEALEGKENQYTAAVRKETGATADIRNREPHLIKEASDAADVFIKAPGGGAALLPGGLDEVRTKSIDELTALQTTGTPEEKFKNALLAKAQAEAENISPIPLYQQNALAEFAAIDPAHYTPDYALRLGKDEIIGEFERDALSKKAVGAKTLTPDEKAEIRRKAIAAFKGASRQIRTLAESRAVAEVSYYDAKLKEKQKDLHGLGDFQQKAAEVDVVVTVLENATALDEENTLTRASEIAEDPAKLSLLAEKKKVAPKTPGYTETETNLNEEQRVYEWYRLINPHYVRDPEKRDEMFDALVRVFPPDAMKKFLKTHPHGNREQVIQTTIQMLDHIRTLGLAL